MFRRQKKPVAGQDGDFPALAEAAQKLCCLLSGAV